jgi:phosphate transport system substrate-binding protein
MLRRPRRRFGAIAVALPLAIVLAACGSSKKSSSTTAAGSTATTAAATATTGSAASGATTAASSSAGSSSATTAGKLNSATLTGSGSTFIAPFVTASIDGFKKAQSAVTITYGGGGSGKGRQDLTDNVVDFAGTDALPAAADISKYKGGALLYFPPVAAPITVSYNLSGVKNLQLSPDTIAKIFERQIKTWNDPAIAADNPGATLPSTAIVVAHRSDSSGTTNNFTTFLTMASPTVWTLKSGSTVEWPADTQAGSGNPGVAQIIKGTAGAIGYVDLSDAKASGLSFASVKNKAGKFVAPTLDGATAALSNTTLKDDLSYTPMWADGDASYPITSPTWLMAYKNQTSKDKGNAVKAFITWMLTDGQTLAPTIDYAPLPKAMIDKVMAQVNQLVIPSS